MSVRCIQNSGEYRVSGAVDRVASSERRDTVSSLHRITRIAPFSTLSKPDSGLILSLAEVLTDDESGLLLERTIAYRPYPDLKIFRYRLIALNAGRLPDDMWDYPKANET